MIGDHSERPALPYGNHFLVKGYHFLGRKQAA